MEENKLKMRENKAIKMLYNKLSQWAHNKVSNNRKFRLTAFAGELQTNRPRAVPKLKIGFRTISV